MHWQADRQSALDRLNAFLPQAGCHYSRQRNLDNGSFESNHVSGLSPWLRCGVISEAEVLQSTLRYHSVSSAEKFIMEVFWRGYFKGWLEHRPQVWLDYQYQLTGLQTDFLGNQQYENAVNGRTGLHCFDTWVEELTETGYLHNHSRMWFASIWIFTLKLPWQLGASFFMHHLLDGDPAANTLSWRWVAGLHTRGKTYLARPDNISKYTNGRFDPVSGLASHAVALREETVYSSTPPTIRNEPPTTANLLLVTDDCCHADSILSLDKTESIFGLTGTAGNVTSRVQDFRDKAVVGSCQAISDKLAKPFFCGSFKQLLDHLKDNKFTEITTVAPSMGSTREMLDLLETRLKPLNIRLLRTTRDYDRLCWPHATAGFFKLKNKIPDILRDLEITEGGQQSLTL